MVAPIKSAHLGLSGSLVKKTQLKARDELVHTGNTGHFALCLMTTKCVGLRDLPRADSFAGGQSDRHSPAGKAGVREIQGDRDTVHTPTRDPYPGLYPTTTTCQLP